MYTIYMVSYRVAGILNGNIYAAIVGLYFSLYLSRAIEWNIHGNLTEKKKKKIIHTYIQYAHAHISNGKNLQLRTYFPASSPVAVSLSLLSQYVYIYEEQEEEVEVEERMKKSIATAAHTKHAPSFAFFPCTLIHTFTYVHTHTHTCTRIETHTLTHAL